MNLLLERPTNRAPTVGTVPWPVAYIAHFGVWCPGWKIDLLTAERGITESDIREAVEGCPVEWSGWVNHPQNGWQLQVIGTTYDRRRLKVVLYPVDQSMGLWRLATAMNAR